VRIVGSISFGELTACAQGKINQRFRHDETRQHVVLTGNDGLQVVAAADTPSQSSTNPAATLRDMAQADARWDVRAVPSAKTLAIGIAVTCNRNGYLYVLCAGSDQREFLKLYPSAPADQNILRANEPYRIPKLWHSDGPPGTDYVLTLVTAQPRDLSATFGQQLTAPATYKTSSGLPDVLGVCRNLSAQSSQNPESRNLPATDPGLARSSGYGATLLTIQERAE